MALPELLQENGIDCDSLGISIIGVNGKNQIPKYWRLYSQFGIPIIVVIDNDNSEGKQSSNKNIASCFNVDVKDFTENVEIVKVIQSNTEAGTRLIVLEKDFETSFEKELEKISPGSFKTFEAEAKDLIKPIGKQQKGVIARYTVRKAKTIEGFQSEIGLTLAEEISKLI